MCKGESLIHTEKVIKMKEKKTWLKLTTIFIVLFMLWTLAVCFFDVGAISPDRSKVGFATINKAVHDFTWVNFSLYILTDWLSIVPICFVAGFGFLGFAQSLKRKSLLKVDRDILLLGVFYSVVLTVFLFFEKLVVNYRPILINGVAEASYPSSTTMLVICVMSSAAIQFNRRIKKRALRLFINLVIVIFTIFMVVCRLLSGVHWFSDIIGGALISTGLVSGYYCSICAPEKRM